MSSSQKGDEEWRKISNNSVTKSWGGMTNFMHSYGLKPYNPEDYDQAHQIIDAMKESDWANMSPAEKDATRAHYERHSRK